MNVLTRFLQHFGYVRHSPYTIYLDRKLFAHLSYLASQQHISLDEFVESLLKKDVTETYTAVANLQLWEGLSPREKQVAALTCLGYTNEEIWVSPIFVRKYTVGIREIPIGSCVAIRSDFD